MTSIHGRKRWGRLATIVGAAAAIVSAVSFDPCLRGV